MEKMESVARESIRSVAAHLFAERGFAATSTREICQRAKVTKPVLYYHFGSKGQLYRELLLDACNESQERLLFASQKSDTAKQRIIDALAADFALTMREPDLSLMFFRMIFAPRKESRVGDLVEKALEWIRVLESIIAEGVRRGEMKGRPRDIAEALAGIHTIYTMGYLLTGQPKLTRALARRIVDLLLKDCGEECVKQ